MNNIAVGGETYKENAKKEKTKGLYIFMIKGVNKQVVEINETGNEFFEKAIFFVRPEYSSAGESRLKENAQGILNKASTPPGCRERKGKERFPIFLKLIAAALLGASVTGLIALLI